MTTGEEDERQLVSFPRVKLFAFEKKGEGAPSEWNAKGIGALKVNQNKDGGKTRVVMRKDGNLEVRPYSER